MNLKLGIQYTIYTQFNGGFKNYDGAGRNAGDNNTLFLFAWLVFWDDGLCGSHRGVRQRRRRSPSGRSMPSAPRPWRSFQFASPSLECRRSLKLWW